MIIRPARATDAVELARLVSLLGYPIRGEEVVARWGAWTSEGNEALVAEGDGLLLGVVTLHRMHVLHRPKPVGRITSLVVDPAARGRGVGRALVRAAEAHSEASGCGLLEVTSHVRFAAAHDFYRHLGYEETSLRFARVFP